MRTKHINSRKLPKCGNFFKNHILNPNDLNYSSKWCTKSNKKQLAYISWRFHSNCLALPAHTSEEHVHSFQRSCSLDFQVLAALGGHVFPATKTKESEWLAKNSTWQIKDGFPVDKLIASSQRLLSAKVLLYLFNNTDKFAWPKRRAKFHSSH